MSESDSLLDHPMYWMGAGVFLALAQRAQNKKASDTEALSRLDCTERLLLGLLLGFTNKDYAVIGARDGAANVEQVALGIDGDDLDVLDGDL
jgi:hypothetical protein